jgi:3-methyladenine DNA glycosylase AlkD
MNTLHHKIVTELKAAAGTANRDQSTQTYTGSAHLFYAVPTPKRREIIKAVIKEQTEEELLFLCEALFSSSSHEEKTIGAMLLTYRRDVRALADFSMIDRWLGELVGWAEVDTFCYNTFTTEEILADLKAWQQFICALAHDTNINKRRAALVFLAYPVAHSQDDRLHRLANKLILTLAPEKDILITKAISWLLRSQIDTNKAAVAEFISKHEAVLPKIALRETRRKLETGKKNK